ncbi:hypothetical protein FM105_03215 [Brevibacterium yomogidense]|uniref:DUF262 domain-containing protein n=2 Tax=Brevibacterium yomogidense TaxID=946573 RepID=A0A1X6X223_9MICO|nr:hypothetical protein FM105_03215 [Brevibacterium yomogidense]
MTVDAMSRDQPNVMSVKEIFDHHRYRIPLYQRAYSWTAAEIHTLLADVRDARLDAATRRARRGSRDYYIGSLVVDAMHSDEGTLLEVVDGQQRLTTLFIILSLTGPGTGNEDPQFTGALTFEGRDAAAEDLRRLARDGAGSINRLTTPGIRLAAELVEQAVSRGAHLDPTNADLVDSVAFSSEDATYLREHVKILQTALPSGTDLNHYFEVMNTRGEQLEKHEILKANMIRALPHTMEQAAFSAIWDACSVLERHVQTQFSPTQKPEGATSERTMLFGSGWNTFRPESADELFDHVQAMLAGDDTSTSNEPLPTPHGSEQRILLADVLTASDSQEDSRAGGDPDQESGSYGSIIDFPNLLLHVLRIQRRETFTWEDPRDGAELRVRLEDKYLLSEFDRSMLASRHLDDASRRAEVREFAYLLLKTRYLLDTYVIRTQLTAGGDDEENWVLHRALRYPAPPAKTAQLSARATFRTGQSTGSDENTNRDQVHRQVLMLQAMFQVSDTRRASKYFLFQILEWLHQQEAPSAVDGESFVKKLETMARSRLRALDFTAVMNDGTHVPNFLFNVLDYELWRLAEVADGSELTHVLPHPNLVAGLTEASPTFRFRYRTSVEHYYPVQPSSEQGHRRLDPSDGNHFGNLCLMSRSENARRNNLMPIAKAREFQPARQSLKFQLMSALALEAHDWAEEQIHAHGSAMLRVMQNAADTPVAVC